MESRRWRRVLAWVGVVIVGLPLVAIILLGTPPVTRLVARRLLPTLSAQLNGSLVVEDIGGSLLGRLTLRGVTLRDPEGEIVVQADRVELDYGLWDLLHRRVSLGPILLERPLVRLLKGHPGEPYSLIRVFAKEPTGTQQPGTVDLTIRDLEVRGGTVFATVWRQPGDPQRETVQALDTVQLESVNLRFPSMTYAAAPTAARVAQVEIATAQGRLIDPALVLRDLGGEVNLRGDSLDIVLNTVQLPQSRFSASAWLIAGAAGGRGGEGADRKGRYAATAHVTQLMAGDIAGFISGASIPPTWTMRGDVRASSRAAGTVLIGSPNFELLAAGGSVRGKITVVGAGIGWSAEDSRLRVTGVEVQRLLQALHIRSPLRATLDGVVTAHGRSGSADLRVAGLGGYGVRRPLNGHVRASGSFDDLAVDTRLAGDLGNVALAGRVATGKHFRVSDLRGTLEHVNLAAVDARMPESNLNAQLEGDVLFGSLPREGHLKLFIDSSTVRGVRVDTGVVIATVASGLLTADTILLRAPGLKATGSGTFGLYEDQTGDLTLTINAPSLREMGHLVAALTGDSMVALDGSLQVDVAAKGSVRNYTLAVAARGRDMVVKGLEIAKLDAKLTGRTDAFDWTLTADIKDEAVIGAAGAAALAGPGKALTLDSLTIERGDADWRLDHQGRVELRNGAWTFDQVALRRDPEPGRLTITGAMPGNLAISVQRLPLEDLVRKGKRGRDSLPELEGQATLAQGKWNATLALVAGRAERRPLTVELTTAPLHAKVVADSLDLKLVSPFVPSIRGLEGRLDGSVAVEGSVAAPRFHGRLDVLGVAVTVPATGVRYTNLNGPLVFSGDALRLDGLEIAVGGGLARLEGSMRFTRLDRPELDLTIQTRRFAIMNRRDFLKATATGALRLRGPFNAAALTGRVGVDEGTAFMQKFIRPTGIDLSDPMYAQFVDTTVLQREALGAGPVERFVAGLRIDSMAVDLGDKFWLRSPDAGIQLAGRLSVSKADGEYRLFGTVRTVRGTYRMALAPGVTREFAVREGTIRFFGSPAADATLNLEVEHVLRTAAGERITITSHIGGTIAKPTMRLTSDVSPPLSETEIISYLLFGAPTMQAFVGGGGSQRRSLFEQSAERLVGVLSGQIERAVVDGLGLPIDYFRIKPGEVQSGLSGTELLIGMQISMFGRPAFLRASPRFCPREQLLSLDQIGINLESRLSPQWGVAAAVDPIQGCEAIIAGSATVPYQFGMDLFWEKR